MKHLSSLAYSFAILLLFAIGGYACIQVIDRINPVIADFTILPEYGLQDTICVTTSYSDNERLTKIVIQMNASPLGSITGSLGTVVFSTEVPIELTRGGRRFDASTCFPVPVNTSPGDYAITVKVTDGNNNTSSITKYTKILPDQVKPIVNETPKITIFKNNSFIDLVPDAQGIYTICQLDVLDFTGEVRVSDNKAIRNLTALLTVVRGNRNVNIFVNSTDLNNTITQTIQLKGFFVPPIRVPETDVEGVTVGNGDILELTVIATDFAGNVGNSTPLRFRIDCDRVSPTIRLSTSRPQLDSIRRELLVVEGGSFRLLGGVIADNKSLGNLNVTFKRRNGANVSSRNIALTGVTANLATLIPETFNIPSNAAINDEFELVLTVTDNSGNQAIYVLRITIKVDDPVLITVIRPIVRLSGGVEREISLSTNPQSPTLVPLDAQSISIQGKVSDDNFIEYIQIFWTASPPNLTPLVDARNLQELVYDFTQAPLVNTFAITSSRNSQNYRLIIRSKDNKVETERTFYVRTQD
jgi:hypothetical protein